MYLCSLVIQCTPEDDIVNSFSGSSQNSISLESDTNNLCFSFSGMFFWSSLALVTSYLCMLFWRSSYLFQCFHTGLVRESPSLVSLSRDLGELAHCDYRKAFCLCPWADRPVSCLWAGNLVKWVHEWMNSSVHRDWPHIKVHWIQSGAWVCGCGPHAWLHRGQPSTETGLESGSMKDRLAPLSLGRAQNLGLWVWPGAGVVPTP